MGDQSVSWAKSQWLQIQCYGWINIFLGWASWKALFLLTSMAAEHFMIVLSYIANLSSPSFLANESYAEVPHQYLMLDTVIICWRLHISHWFSTLGLHLLVMSVFHEHQNMSLTISVAICSKIKTLNTRCGFHCVRAWSLVRQKLALWPEIHPSCLCL